MLEVKNLTKEYGKNKSVTDLNFSIRQNETVGLLGPNGAGKSTTMRMITGYIPPTAGSVRILGEDVFENPLAARRHIGYLPELPPLYLDMTVFEHLQFVCSLHRIKRAEAGPEIQRVCFALHIEDVSERPIKNLSKGYRQRVGFAAALIGNPKLLILDEPTVGLDPRQIIEIRALIQKLSGSMSIIISSHILSEIASVCFRIIIMHKGCIVANGSPSDIEKSHSTAFRVEVVARGDSERASQVLQKCLAGRASVETERLAGGEARFLVAAPEGVDLREQIFHAFAQSEEKLSLITLRSLHKTLEEVFIDITRS